MLERRLLLGDIHSTRCFFKPHVETQSSFPHVRFCLQQNKKAQPREIPALRLARLASAPTGGALRGAYHRSPAVRDSPVTGSQTRGSGIWTRAATVQWARLREQLQSLTAERLEAVPGSLPIPPFVLSAVLSQTDWLPPGQSPGCELVSCAQGGGNLHAGQEHERHSDTSRGHQSREPTCHYWRLWRPCTRPPPSRPTSTPSTKTRGWSQKHQISPLGTVAVQRAKSEKIDAARQSLRPRNCHESAQSANGGGSVSWSHRVATWN